MAGFLDWVRDALHPRYEVLAEVARGGMGAVFRGRDPQLERDVAIKVLLPEIATTRTAERFLREARVLAQLQHSHIVPVHETGEADGLFYYVMDFIDRPTLHDRLAAGPLSVEDARKLGRDLLDALEAVHAEQVIHRDIKPSNIFFGGGRTLLADFGIAKALAEPAASTTRTGHIVGTPNYMAPEQLSSGEATTQSDLYLAAMVIYQALTGRQWRVGIQPSQGDWSGVPRRIARVLARGLAVDPSERWPDASVFRHRLWHTRVREYQWRAAMLTGGGLVAGALVVWTMGLGAPKPVTEGRLSIQIGVSSYAGPAGERWLADSIPEVFARLMSSAPDFRVCPPTQSCQNPTTTMHASIAADDSTFNVRIDQEELRGRFTKLYQGRAQPIHEWRREVDRASDAGMRAIWESNSPLAEWLPLDALPREGGFDAFRAAERLLYQARWSDARSAFEEAIAVDSTCLLCSWRITEIQRWLVESPDSTHVLRVSNAIDRFPAHYRPLIEVRWLGIEDRLDTLERATRVWRGFPYAWFILGDELYHRGPLAGRSRDESIRAFDRATLLDSTFGPAWEHLAWAHTAAGNAQGAMDAFAHYDALLERDILTDDFARMIRAMTGMGIAWRFDPQNALDHAARDLRDPQIANYGDVGAGPRYLAVFESREGMIALANLLINNHPSDDVRFAAEMAIALANVALGRLREASAKLDSMELFYPHRDVALFSLKLDATIQLLDSAALDLDRRELMSRLSIFERAGDEGARWLRALLAEQSGAPSSDSSDGLKPPLSAVLEATAISPRAALEHTSSRRLPLIAETPRRGPNGFELEHLPDPYYRTILRFFRARWFRQLDNPLAAADELLFHEASDLTVRPLGIPEAGEVDWAFGTLARWRRAQLLEESVPGDACPDYEVVAARWIAGDAVFAARADSASDALERLQCPVKPELRW